MSYYGLDALLVSSRARAAHAYRKRRHHLSGSYGARECHVGVFPAAVGASNVEPSVFGPKGRASTPRVRVRYTEPRDRSWAGLRCLTGPLQDLV